jgi:hypothetical protein
MMHSHILLHGWMGLIFHSLSFVVSLACSLVPSPILQIASFLAHLEHAIRHKCSHRSLVGQIIGQSRMHNCQLPHIADAA